MNVRRLMTEKLLRELWNGAGRQKAEEILRRDFPNEPWSIQDAATTAAIELLKDPERTKEFQAIVEP